MLPRAALLFVALSQFARLGTSQSASLEAGWLEFVREVRAARSETAAAPPTVVLTVSDARYVDRFEEFVLTVRALAGGAAIGAVALDAAARDAFAALGVPCAHPAGARDAPADAGAPELVMHAKFDGTLHLLRAGYRVVVSEMDVFWRRSPLALDGALGGDFLVAAHNYGASATAPPQREINIGFYIAKPARAVLHAFELVHAWLHAKRRHRQPKVFCAFDQKVLHYALFGPSGDDGYMRPKLHRECRMPRRELGQLFDNASAPGGFVRYIPWPRLPHWHDALFEDAVRSPEMLAAHLWRRTGDGAAATRIRIAYEHGLYADAAASVVARYLSGARNASSSQRR